MKEKRRKEFTPPDHTPHTAQPANEEPPPLRHTQSTTNTKAPQNTQHHYTCHRANMEEGRATTEEREGQEEPSQKQNNPGD